VDALASRLGVGERQLRRLFKQHLGASPIAVAQTRRVLLAKQLIHETTLPMSEVALASGFGSIRRFNETFQRLFNRPPSALRRAGAVSSATTDGEVTLNLRYRPPYDWASMLGFLEVRAIPGVEAVRGNAYMRTLAFDGQHAVVTIKPGASNTLRVTVRTTRMSALPTIIARVRRVFDLSADPRAIASHLSEDPSLAPLLTARPGLRVPGAWDGFELAVRAVLGQQVTVKAAVRLAGFLVATGGEPLDVRGAPVAGLTHVFPTAARLASLDPTTLPMPRARAAALISLAGSVDADPAIFNSGRTLEDVVARLRALKGIGEWTAQYIAMREMREPDAFPAADVGLMRALAGPDGTRPTPRQLQTRAERWRPWRAYAALHLWMADVPTSS
jgi:AraC family transcriptional regulator, regulatory protein of adaptative response / DNA-3-methyladenine glycosylase II